jgi:hypothetical protein
MRTVKLLLGNSHRRLNNLIEVLVRDVCYEQAFVDIQITSRIGEFIRRGFSERPDLLMLAPEHLLPEPSRKTSHNFTEEAVRAIQTLKRRSSNPIIVMGVPEAQQIQFLEAGAESAFGVLFNHDGFKAEIRRVLRVEEFVEAPAPPRWSFADALLRGWERLKQA